MERIFHILAGFLIIGGCAYAAGRLAWASLRNSEDPVKLVVKWVLTGAGFGYLISFTFKAPQFSPMVAAVIGICLGIMWAPNLGSLLAKPFTSLYDGGGTPDELRPLYSMAESKRKAGKYLLAIAEVRRQLERFPTDFQGWTLLAQIYGDDLKDLENASACVQEILSHGNHTPKNISYTLNRLADWHLAIAQDPDGARSALERIILLYPDTEFSNQASERIAHLAKPEMLAAQKERPRILLTPQEQNIGLRDEVALVKAREESPAEAAARLVGHLDQHPLDTEARESLARIYLEFYQRLDLAADQLEQLINAPNQTQKHVAHWLNTLADFHLTLSADKAAAVSTLQRLIERYPGTAVAANAEKRIAYMEIELRKHAKDRVVQLGTYEQNIGLKGKVPKFDE
jgi:outer membrane protein assembly factor BamD (BamD/ComL family)